MADRIVGTDIGTTAANTHAVDQLIQGEIVVVTSDIKVTATGVGSDGIHSDNASNKVMLQSGVLISSAQHYGVSLNGGGSHILKIDQSAVVTGGDIGVWLSNKANLLENAGTIRGAVGVEFGGGQVQQTGTITATRGAGLSISGDSQVTNTGLIQGEGSAVAVFWAVKFAVINNYGTMIGNTGVSIYLLSSDGSTLNNAGHLEGTVIFGAGQDLYDGRNGTIKSSSPFYGDVYLDAGNDRAYGGDGSEIFNGGKGNDTIDGGGGQNVAIFSGQRSEYDITRNPNGTITVSENQSNRDGTDTLKNIRFAKFSDETVTLTNAAPDSITLSKSAVGEDVLVNSIVATLAAHDADGDEVSYTLVAGSSDMFKLDNGKLLLAKVLDYETQNHQHSITVEAKDIYGEKTLKTFTIDVNNAIETTPFTLTGTANVDSLKGESGNDILSGLAANDSLFGEAGNDRLTGGAGNDMLTGGAGQDIFAFDSALGKTTAANKKTNLDTITDFSVADDTIYLSKSVFGKIAKKGVLSSKAFWDGGTSHDATDRIILNKKTGALFYDSDGNGAHAAVQFATVNPNNKLKASDFFVM